LIDSKRFFVATKLLLLFSVLLLLAGCARQASNTEVSDDSGRELRFTTIKSGTLGFSFIEGKTPNFYIFKTAAEWEDFWEAAMGRSIYEEGEKQKDEPIDPDPYSVELEPIRPDVDFRSQIVVGILYERPTSGFEVRIDKVVETDKEIVVHAFLDGKDAGGYENTAPYQFVKVKTDSDLPVRFDMAGASHEHSKDHNDPQFHHAPSEEHEDGDHHMGEPHEEGSDHLKDSDHHHRTDNM